MKKKTTLNSQSNKQLCTVDFGCGITVREYHMRNHKIVSAITGWYSYREKIFDDNWKHKIHDVFTLSPTLPVLWLAYITYTQNFTSIFICHCLDNLLKNEKQERKIVARTREMLMQIWCRRLFVIRERREKKLAY